MLSSESNFARALPDLFLVYILVSKRSVGAEYVYFRPFAILFHFIPPCSVRYSRLLVPFELSFRVTSY